MQRLINRLSKSFRQGEGKDLNNESTPMAFENIKQVIDDMATDATMLTLTKSNVDAPSLDGALSGARLKTPSFRAGI